MTSITFLFLLLLLLLFHGATKTSRSRMSFHVSSRQGTIGKVLEPTFPCMTLEHLEKMLLLVSMVASIKSGVPLLEVPILQT